MSLSIDSSTNMTQIVVKYNKVDNDGDCNGDSNRKCLPKLYQGFIQGFSKIAVLRISSLTNSSTSAIQIAVKYDEVDDSGKLIKKSSKSQKIDKKSIKPKRCEKFVKAIGLKKRLPKYQSFISL